MNIVELVRSKIKKVTVDVPSVCISGGVDSTVVLHHVIHDLMNGSGSNVRTFTATFGNELDERSKARRVADYYGTTHTEILITKTKIISMLRFVLRHYPFPRYNIWGWVLVEEIKRCNLSDLFIAEGADELFGYPDRSFLEGWAGQLVWVNPGWKVPCNCFNIRLHRPFMEIQEDVGFPITEYYKPPNKEKLREAYRNILPDFVIKEDSSPPSLGFYKMMGMSKEELQVMAVSAWLESRDEIRDRIDKRLQPEMRDVP